MKIGFKHRSNLYLSCNRTSSVYRCNNVNVSYQQPTCASSQNQQLGLPTVSSHRPVHAYRKLPEFAIKLHKQKLFKRVIIEAISAFAQYDGASTEQSLNGSA